MDELQDVGPARTRSILMIALGLTETSKPLQSDKAHPELRSC
jgi:hypothetical protein